MSIVARILALIVPVVLLVGGLVLGAVFAGLLIAAALTAAVVLGARVAWLRWRLRRGHPVGGPVGVADRGAKDAIDAEFHVIEQAPPEPPRSRDKGG